MTTNTITIPAGVPLTSDAPMQELVVSPTLTAANQIDPRQATLEQVFQLATGAPYLGADIIRDVVTAIAALKQDRDHFQHLLRMIAERPRVDFNNPESLADVGHFAYKAARKALKLG